MAIWLPFVDASEAGLWLFWVLEREVIAVPRPSLRISDDQLHCNDGPAVAWPNGARYWFWRGMQVTQQMVESPETMRPREDILAEPNVEIRRVKIDRFGVDRFMRSIDPTKLHEDECGILWRVDLVDDEPLVMVEVENSTPEPEGWSRRYFLRVDPRCRPLLADGTRGRPQELTARNAVASTFGMRGHQYRPVAQT